MSFQIESLRIERGLFRADFIDHHAILGAPIDADIKDIRKRYLKIARRLHPDSCASESDTDKQKASELLSKLVNPAWEKLSQEKDRADYAVLLKLKAQAARQSDSMEISGSLAKQLSTAPNPDHFYLTSLKDITTKQYEQLDQAIELIGQLSELNLVYLLRKESEGGIQLNEPVKKAIYTGSNLPDSSQGPKAATPPPATAPKPAGTPAEQYYRRAEVYLSKNNYAQAILELRDAIKIEPQNSRYHALMGMIYFRQNQTKMAKISFQQALKFNPKNTLALEGLQRLEQGQGSQPDVSKPANPREAPKPNPKPNKPNDQGGGGLFGLFGGKKK